MVETVQGVKELLHRLKIMPEDVKKQASAAVEKSAEELVAQMKRFAHFGKYSEGDINASITWNWTGANDRGAQDKISESRVAIKGSEKLAATITAGSTGAFYAGFVEFGTAEKPNHPATPAQPFFFVSYRLLRKRIRSRISRALNKAIKASAGK